MARPAQHIFAIEPLPNGTFRFFGQFLGKQTRKALKPGAVLQGETLSDGEDLVLVGDISLV